MGLGNILRRLKFKYLVDAVVIVYKFIRDSKEQDAINKKKNGGK